MNKNKNNENSNLESLQNKDLENYSDLLMESTIKNKKSN